MADNIINFIKNNTEAINVFRQVDVDWVERYKKEIESTAALQNKDFTQAVNQIKKKSPQLNRENVRDYYSDDMDGVYNGFIATILWGHIFAVNLRKVISYSKEDIAGKIKKVLADVNNNPAIVFQKMKDSKNKEYHIDGINVSFFTKIFYFTSQIHGNTKLLILDKKMWDVYNSFRIANGKAPKKFGECTYNDYINYCDIICSIPDIKNPDKLEAFLFEHNNVVKSFLPPQSKDSKNPKINNKKSKKTDNLSDNILPQKNKGKRDELIAGRWITLNGEPFRLFVAKRPNEFYFCQLCYKHEEDESKRRSFDINTISDAIKIIHKFSDNEWCKGRKWKTYRFVKFEGDNAESKALALYNDILSFIEKL